MQRDCAQQLKEARRELSLLRRQHAQDQANVQDMLFELGRLAAEHPELNVSLQGRKKEHAGPVAGDVPVLGQAAEGEPLPDVRAADVHRPVSGRSAPRRALRAGRRGRADAQRPPLPKGAIAVGSQVWEQQALPFEGEGDGPGELPTTQPAPGPPQEVTP